MRAYQPVKQVRIRSDARRHRLWALGYKSYGDYLRSAHWRTVKARYRASDLPQDCICGEDDVHLHHMTYERVGAEQLGDLTPLCRNCHALIHVLEARGQIGLDFAGFEDADRARVGRERLIAAAQRREQERQLDQARLEAEVLALPLASRLMRAVDHARVRHINISHRLHIIGKAAARGNRRYVHRGLVCLEELIYDWPDWAARCESAPDQHEDS